MEVFPSISVPKVMCPSNQLLYLLQVEVGEVIRLNDSDYVPADTVLLSSRYRAQTGCTDMGGWGEHPRPPVPRMILILPSCSLILTALAKQVMCIPKGWV